MYLVRLPLSIFRATLILWLARKESISNGDEAYLFDKVLKGVIFSHSPATALTSAMGVG